MFVGPRCAVLVLLTVATALIIQEAPAAAATSTPGSPCSSATVSAINQYCENIPGATGGHSAGPGTPALASRLPPSEVTTLRGTRGTGGAGGASGTSGTGTSASAATNGPAQAGSPGPASPQAAARPKLLSLPAPGPRERISGVLPHASGWSLLSELLIVLGVATAAATGLALVARRRRTTAGA